MYNVKFTIHFLLADKSGRYISVVMNRQEESTYNITWRSSNLDQLTAENREDIVAAVIQYTHGPPVTVNFFMVGSDEPAMAVFVRRGRYYLAVTARDFTLIFNMRDLDNLLIAHLLELDQVIPLS